MKFLRQWLFRLYLVAIVVFGGRTVWESVYPPPKVPSVAVAPRHPDRLLMDAVRKVSADASLLMSSSITGFGRDEPSACTLARRGSQRHDFPASMVQKWDDECVFGTSVRESTEPVFHAIAQSHTLPEVTFAFDVSGEPHADWHTVGLFADLDTCTRTLEAAMALGMGVRSCLPWTPRF